MGRTNARGEKLETSAGFTLLELMIAVAVVGVLASIAIVSFSGKSKKMEARSEVSAIFAELKIRQEQHLLENGSYLSTGADDNDTWPTTPGANGGKNSLTAAGRPAEWDTLRIDNDTQQVYCAYVTIAGAGGDATNVGAIAGGADFAYVPPATDWYYLLARCDMDQDPAVDSYYFSRSDDDHLYFINQGK